MSYNSVKDLMIAICDEVRRLTGTGSLIPHIEIPERLRDVGEGAGDYKIQIKLVKQGTDILIYDIINISGPNGMSWSLPLPEVTGYRPVENIDTVSDIVDGDKVIVIEYSGSASEGLIYTIITEDEKTYAILGTNTTTANNAYGTCTDSNIIIAEEYEGYKVEKIGKNAFSKNKAITSVVVPDSVVEFGTSVFSNCTALSRINLPAGVLLGAQVFYNCSALTQIYIPEGLTYSATTYGPFENSGLISVSFSPLLEEISGRLFLNCKNLQSVVIPDSVLIIGQSAFAGCTALSSVTLPKNAEIKIQAFNKCTSLKSIHISKGIITSGTSYGPFENSGIETVTFDNDATIIPGAIMLNAVNLKNMTIPQTVETIEQAAFAKCTSLTSVIIPDSVFTIGQSAFSGCSALSSVTLPKNAVIYQQAFQTCTSLKNIHFPKGVTARNVSSTTFGAFAKSGVEKATFDNDATIIPAYILIGSTALINVTLPATITEVGQSAFAGCTALSSVSIPPSVSVFGSSSFSGCPLSGTVTLGGIGNPVTSIGSNAFKNTTTTNITVYVADGVTSLRNQPWGASVASVTYRSATTGEIVNG